MTASRKGQHVQIDGFLHPAFDRVGRVFREILGKYPGGAAVCVYHRGAPVVDLWGGIRNDAGAPWERDTMAPSFSTTKGVAATLLHMMVDRGLLDYDDRVARHWPEFGRAGKADITVRQVLAHQSGLYHIRQMVDHAERMLDWNFMVRAIERTPPIHEPGTRTGYHGLTFGFLVGEILQRVTGKPFPQLVQEELATPLQLDGMYIGAPEAVLPRAARLIWPARHFLRPQVAVDPQSLTGGAVMRTAAMAQSALKVMGLQFDLGSLLDALAPRGIRGFDFSGDATLRASIPAANGLFTARALAKMYAALANGGAVDGVRLLSQRTLARATQVQDPTHVLAVIPVDMRWRLGYHGIATTRGVPRGAFGHFGFGGSGAWAYPRRKLSAAFVVNSGLGTPFGDLRTARISGAVLASVERLAARESRESTVPVVPPTWWRVLDTLGVG